MRITAQLFCLAASLAAAPAFAQTHGKDSAPVSQTLSQASKGIASTTQPAPSMNLGLGISKGGTERTFLPLAPIQAHFFAMGQAEPAHWNQALNLELLRLLDPILLEQALQVVRDCACRQGCPGCVGPVGEIGEDGKATAIALLEALTE